MPDFTWGAGTGLDRIRTLAEELAHTPHVPYTQFGLSITQVDKGRVEMTWTPGSPSSTGAVSCTAASSRPPSTRRAVPR